MAKVLRNLVSSVLCALLVALLVITFAVMQRNSFDLGDIMSDSPLLGAVWAAFVILLVASIRLSRAWGGKHQLHP